jgi:hypothetical protein
MKHIIKYFTILLVLVSFASCEEEDNFKQSDASLTGVYSITEISGNGSPFKINIYKEKSLIIEYTTEVNLSSFTSAEYSDTSTDTNYQITVNKIENSTTTVYVISADKTTGDGTITIDGSSVQSIKVSETQLYN